MGHKRRIVAICLGVLFALSNTSSEVTAQDSPIEGADNAARPASAMNLSELLQLVREGTTEDTGREPARDAAQITDGERRDRANLAALAPFTGVDTSALETEEFRFVRIIYSDGGLGQGGPWQVDYPAAEYFFAELLAKHTDLTVNPESVNLELTDPALSEYPFIYLAEGGHLRLSDDEATALHDYLLSGGFLMVDDFWGDDQWASLAAQLKHVFPDREPIELWPEHEIFFSYFSVSERPGVPSIVSLLSENSTENPADAVYRGLLDDDGGLMAIFLHNMDFGDAWEHSGDARYPEEALWGSAIPMGINIVVYALTH